MFGSEDEASWDTLASFASRVFYGVSGDAHARVNGSLTLVDVAVEHFTPETVAEVREAINSALNIARSELARHLANANDLDLPEPIREVLASNVAPEAFPHGQLSGAFGAECSGVVAHIDPDTWLVTDLAVPAPETLRLVPKVVNEALAAAESARDLPPVDELFDSRWASIVGGLQDVDDLLDEILAEHDHGQGSAPA